MKNKKWIAAICCGALLLPAGIPGTSRQSKAASQPKEYVIQVESDKAYEKISEQYEEEIKEEPQKESMLENANIMVAELTSRQAQTLDQKKDITVERNITFSGESKGKAETAQKALRKDIRRLAKGKWNQSAISADAVKKASEGKNISIAILDSGVDALSDIPFDSQVSLVPEEGTDDATGHGTIIANLIAANDNGSCQAGIIPKNAPVKLHNVRILDEDNQTSLSRVLEGLQWCIDHKIDVVNMSFGTEGKSGILHDMVKKARDAGILMVSSVGNGGEEKQGVTEYPASYPEVIGVGSVNENMQHSTFSSTGKAVELAAPGENIPITSYWGMQGSGSGTSYAAAHVTAAAALLWAENPGKTAESIRTLIDRAATPIGNPEQNGHGILNYQNASQHPELADSWEETIAEEGKDVRQDPEKNMEENPDTGSLTPSYEVPVSLKASWGKPKHSDLIPSVNGMSTHEVNVVKRAVRHADDKSSLGKYDILHARQETNYVSAAKVFFQASKQWNGNQSTLNSLAGGYNSSDELSTTLKAQTQKELKAVMTKAATVNLEEPSKQASKDMGRLQLLGMAIHVAGDAYAHKCMCDGSDKGRREIQDIYKLNKKDILSAFKNNVSIGDIKDAASSKNGLTTSRLGTGYFKNTDVSNKYYTDSVNYMKERYSVATKVATNKLLHYYCDKKGTFTPFVFCPYEITTSNYRSKYKYRLRHLIRYLRDAKYKPESSECLKGKNNYSKSDWEALSFDR